MTKEKVEQEYEHVKALVGGDFSLDGLNLEHQQIEKDSTHPNSREDSND